MCATERRNTLGALVSARTATFVGREAERALLLGLLDDDGPVLVVASGIAGIGKSSLLRAFAAEAQAGGAAVVAVDGEAVEPTQAGFLRALSAAMGAELASVDDATQALGARGDHVVLTIDAYERLRLLDDWLRRVFVPALPARARLAIAGRDAPVAAWGAAFGPLMRTLELDSLGPGDGVELLRRLGVPPSQAVPINRALRGHPLSLRLAAATDMAAPCSDRAGARGATDELARVYLAGLEAETRRALDAGSVVRRITIPLLAAMLGPGVAADDAFARLRALPFVRIGDEGLIVHHVLREAVATELRAIDPPEHRRLRAAAWRQLRNELSGAAPGELWRYTADMLYLLENPAIRDAFFPASAPLYSVEPARAEDGDAIAAIARRHEPPAGAEVQRAWWAAAPEAFYVARDADGGVAGYSAVCEPSALPTRLIDRDPVATAWRAHLRAAPLERGQRSLFIRFMCGARSGEQPAPDVSALYLDLKRTYLTMRPALRRVYACARNPEATGATIEPLGFTPLDNAPQLDGITYQTYCNELGAASVDGWLAGLAARDVLADAAPALYADERRLRLDGRVIDLSPLEFGVLRCLHEREDQVVRRETLLSEVWKSQWSGDGNALESVVSALRRKLGDRAAKLETVRGVGYRLRPLI
jgi:Transcriptional regulatory protein, C terminal